MLQKATFVRYLNVQKTLHAWPTQLADACVGAIVLVFTYAMQAQNTSSSRQKETQVSKHLADARRWHTGCGHLGWCWSRHSCSKQKCINVDSLELHTKQK